MQIAVLLFKVKELGSTGYTTGNLGTRCHYLTVLCRTVGGSAGEKWEGKTLEHSIWLVKIQCSLVGGGGRVGARSYVDGLKSVGVGIPF